MNYRKAIGVASTSFFLMILLTKYQNCAPAPTQGNQGESSIDGEVRIVDRWSNEKLAFAEKQVVAHDAAQSVEVHGLCVKGVQGEKLS